MTGQSGTEGHIWKFSHHGIYKTPHIFAAGLRASILTAAPRALAHDPCYDRGLFCLGKWEGVTRGKLAYANRGPVYYLL